MTCNDCLHWVACQYMANLCGYKPEIVGEGAEDCEAFKNKADFVEVVRCSECIYCENTKCTEIKDNTGHSLDVAIFDYCSQGIRRERSETK